MYNDQKKYILLGDNIVRTSDVLNDCTNLCFPTRKDEPLSSILKKMCEKIEGIVVDIDEINNGGGGGGDITDTNFAITNLKATGNRIHDWDGYKLSIFNISDWDIHATGTTTLRIADFTSASNGNVLTLVSNITGEVAWGAVSASDELIKISSNDTTPGYLNGKLVQGQGVLLNELNDAANETLEVTLDLDSTTLVSPAITVLWSVYKNDGTTAITTSSSHSLLVETGSKVGISSTYQYPAAGVGESLPTSTSGTYGATLFGPATPSTPPFTNSATQISSDVTYSQTLSKPKSGLIVVGSQVQFASGNDTTSDSISLSFLPASYFGYSTNTSLTGAQIKALGNKNLQSSRARSLSGVSAAPLEYTYYCYPASYGSLSQIIQNGALPVLTAFTRLADVSITNDVGVSVLMAVYKSNADNAFTNVTLDIT